MFYTYVLQSLQTGKRYIGYTNDLTRRFSQHQNGSASSTKADGPWEIIYYEACKSREKALKREKFFKTGYGRRFLNDRI